MTLASRPPGHDRGVKNPPRKLSSSGPWSAARVAIALQGVLLFACGAHPGPARAAPPASPDVKPPGARPRVVVVSIDGMMPETYLAPDAHGLQVPTLRQLARRGAVARVNSVFPSVTYPAHTTLVTGVPPRVHGITTNRPPDALDKNQAGWRWYAEDIAAPTLWQAVAAQGRQVGLIEWPVTMGAQVSFLVPEYWRAGTGDDQKLLRAISTPGLLAAVERDHPDLWSHLTPPNVADAAQFAIASYLLAHEDPDLLLLHVWRTDDMEHDHGPWSPQAKAAFEQVDRHLGELLAQLERSPRWPATTLVVVSDHGFASSDREIRLNVLFQRKALVTLRDEDRAVVSARVAVSANGGLAFVYAADAEAAAIAEREVRALGPSIGRVYSRAEVVALGGDSSLAFAVTAAPGHQFGDRRTGEVVVEAPGRGTHGYPPADPAMRASFLAVGPGVPPGDLGVIDMTSIAPTLAAWVQAPLPTAMAPPLSLVREQAPSGPKGSGR